MSLRLKTFIPFLIWALIILYLSAFPGPQIEIDFMPPDKLGHFLAYAGLSGWAMFGIGLSYRQFSQRAMILIFLLTASYGVAMEVMQYLFFPNRYFEYGDMLANVLGCILGIFVTRTFLFKIIK